MYIALNMCMYIVQFAHCTMYMYVYRIKYIYQKPKTLIVRVGET